MQHKCKSHTKGSGADAINYLLGERDHKGEIRAGVEVLRGNPQLTADLIDSLKSEHRYTSGVIAWTKEDDPTPEEIQAVITDWERVAFAGLKKSQYTYCAVLHIEADGSKHIHMIVPRVNLEDGRALNIAPPGHEYYFAKWRNVWNFEKGWARPDDPSRARLVQPGVKAFKIKHQAPVQDQKLQITEYLTAEVAAGRVKNRDDVLKVLGDLGEINRVTKEYVSVRLAEGARPLRLKGLLYGDNFSPELVRETGAAAASRPAGREQPDLGAAQEARGILSRAVDSRARYNEDRYGRPARTTGRGASERAAALEGSRRANERAAEVDQFRARWFGQERNQAPGLVVDVATVDNSIDVLTADLRRSGLELVGRQGRERSGNSDSIRSADTTSAVEPRVLQQSSGSEILQTISQIIYPTSGYILNVINGVNSNGLHQPDPGKFGSRGDQQYAPSLGSLQTLSGLNLDAVWGPLEPSKPDLLLPAVARRDLEPGAPVVAKPVRRAGRSPGRDAEAPGESTTGQALRADGGALGRLGHTGARLNDSIRDTVDRVLEAAQRAAQAAGEAVSRAVEDAVAAVRGSLQSVSYATAAAGLTDQAVSRACYQANKSIPRVKIMAADELERFKSEISLADLAQAEYGYEKDVKKSSKNSLVLRSGGDTVVITRGDDGHDIYFSRGDERDCGSIIDFVKNRVADNNAKLVRVRQALRPWLSGSKKPAPNMPARAPERPVAVSKDLQGVLRRAQDLKPYSGSYLTAERKLDAETIKAFKVLQDERGNACFLHLSPDGVTGWESKNKDFTGFAAGGQRGLFVVRPGSQGEPVKRVVITEAAIDALSYAQMNHLKGTLYVSTGGSLSEVQQQQLATVLRNAPEAEVILATDNDQGGHDMAKKVQEVAPERQMARELPTGKDWNQDLQTQLKEQQSQAAQQAVREAERDRGYGMTR